MGTTHFAQLWPQQTPTQQARKVALAQNLQHGKEEEEDETYKYDECSSSSESLPGRQF